MKNGRLNSRRNVLHALVYRSLLGSYPKEFRLLKLTEIETPNEGLSAMCLYKMSLKALVSGSEHVMARASAVHSSRSET